NAASARPGQVEERISGPAWSTLGRGPGAVSEGGRPRSLRPHSGRDSHRDGLPVRAPRAGSAAARAALRRPAGGGAAASVRAARLPGTEPGSSGVEGGVTRSALAGRSRPRGVAPAHDQPGPRAALRGALAALLPPPPPYASRSLVDAAGEGGRPPAPAEPPGVPAVRYARSGDVHLAYSTVGAGDVDIILVLGWTLPMRALFH